jgi:hypothetical protein
MGELGDLVCSSKFDVGTLEATPALAEDVAWTVDEDVGDLRIIEQRLERSEPE